MDRTELLEELEILDYDLCELHTKYWLLVLDSWSENKDDWNPQWLSIWCELCDMLYLSVHDMQRIIKYEIPKSVVYEYNDRKTESFISDRIKENIDIIKDYNLISFHRFFKKSK